MKVAYQGVRGAFSHQAAKLFAEQAGFGGDLEAVSCKSFDEVFKELEAGKVQFGALPLENSSVGSIVANYDLLWQNQVLMVSEVFVPVHHNVIGLEGTDVQSLREIYSHPVALDQCRKFLGSLPQTKAISYWDTSASAFHVKERGEHDIAAIASEYAAKESGLSILVPNVEDHSGNRTRFGIVTALYRSNGNSQKIDDIQEKLLSMCGGKYKLSCVAELSHESGTLARLLKALADEGVNLMKIESRPIPEEPWHYRFFFDIEMERAREKEVAILIEHNTTANKILGRYPKWTEAS